MNQIRLKSLEKGLIFEMTEEFDELLDDEITTVTLTYTDDLIVPEIADREGIHFRKSWQSASFRIFLFREGS